MKAPNEYLEEAGKEVSKKYYSIAENLLIKDPTGFVAKVWGELALLALQNQASDLKKELDLMKELAHAGLPNDCIRGWDEVKFCDIRNGDGGQCKWCSNFE